jgi:hypothetical protein
MKERKRDNHTRGCSERTGGGALREEEIGDASLPLVRVGRWRLGHARQSTVSCFLLIDFEFFFFLFGINWEFYV